MGKKFIIDLDAIEPWVPPMHIPAGQYLAKLFHVKLNSQDGELSSIDWYWEIIRGQESGKQIVSSTRLDCKYPNKYYQHVRAFEYRLNSLSSDAREIPYGYLIGAEVILEIATGKIETRQYVRRLDTYKSVYDERSYLVGVYSPKPEVFKWRVKHS